MRNYILTILVIFNIFVVTYGQEIVPNNESAEAEAAFEVAEKRGNWTSQIAAIATQPYIELPIGIRENIGSTEYAIIITQGKFTPEGTVINAYARLTVPDSHSPQGRRQLYFGATGLEFSHDGQLVGDTRLSLLGNVRLSNNPNWELILKGGHLNRETGERTTNPYVTIGCEGLKEIALNGLVRISNKLIVPVDKQTLTPDFNNFVQSNITIKSKDWNNLLLKISLPPFALRTQAENSNKGAFIFESQDVVLDMSDTENDPQINFPPEYDTHFVAGKESWRGFYMRKLQVTLPEEFKRTGKPVSFSAENFLLDTYGVSGKFSIENLIADNQGTTSADASGWHYTLDLIEATFSCSKIKGGKLIGSIQLPVQQSTSKDNNPQGIRFEGSFDENEYQLKASSLKDIRFNIWKSTAEIDKSSYLELKVKDKRFIPKVVLNGKMDFTSEKNTYNIKNVVFEELTFTTESPQISVKNFGAKGEQRIAGLPVSVSDINLYIQNEKAALQFAIRVGLQEEKFSAKGKFNIYAKKEANSWQYDSFDVSGLRLDNVDVGVAKLSGELQLMQDDPTYGNAFKAKLQASIQNPKIEVEASGVFGCKDFRYWGFDAKVDGLHIPATYITITGFVGGAYWRMRPANTLSSQNNNKAFDLQPDETMGLGLKAGVLGAFQSEKVASFMAMLEIATHKNGGLAYIGIDGDATIMSALGDKISAPFKQLQKGFDTQLTQLNSSIERQTNSRLNGILDSSEKQIVMDDSGAVKQAPIYASMSMRYDFDKKAFHANMAAYINVAGGIIQGTGENGLAGRAVVHVSPEDWYIHIGNSKEMMGLRIGFGGLSLEAKTYFMVGTYILPMPDPPAKVAEILRVSDKETRIYDSKSQLAKGSGFAFGARFAFDTGDMTAGIVYARFAAGLGADMMLINYDKDTHCKNRTGSIGINGWYATGQTYVYLEGELGIKIKLFFIRKRISIIKAGVAALLQGAGPNPFWAKGYLGGYYEVLGGLVKGRFRLKMEFGEKCEFEKETPIDIKIIANISPSENQKNVDVFTSPQISFNLEVDKNITIPDDKGDHQYIIRLENTTITTPDGNPVAGKWELSPSRYELNFTPDDVLPENTQLKIKAQVSLDEFKDGRFQPVMMNGKKAIEQKEIQFTTGTAPVHIPEKNIQYAYPVLAQQNFYPQENPEGFIQLYKGQDYLFEDTNWQSKLYFTPETGDPISADLHYDKSINRIYYTLPVLQNQQSYKLSIVGVSKNSNTAKSDKTTRTLTQNKGGYDNGEGESTYTVQNTKAQASSKEDEIERLSYDFRTSKYQNLKAKVQAFNLQRGLFIKVSSDVVLLQNDMNTDEPFDKVELLKNTYTKQPLLQAEALLDAPHDAPFREYLYNTQAQQIYNRLNTGSRSLSSPPKDAVVLFSFYETFISEGKYDPDLRRVLPFRYDVWQYYKQDWQALDTYLERQRLSGNYPMGQALTNRFLSTHFPAPAYGQYNALLRYRLPDGSISSEHPIYYEFRP